jgi:transcriptional regulator with XRE-family HTH domain
MTLEDMATRVDTTRSTLGRLERGDFSVSMALLARVLGVLGLEADLDQIGRDDELGQRLQDIRLRRPRTIRRSQPDA